MASSSKASQHRSVLCIDNDHRLDGFTLMAAPYHRRTFRRSPGQVLNGPQCQEMGGKQQDIQTAAQGHKESIWTQEQIPNLRSQRQNVY